MILQHAIMLQESVQEIIDKIETYSYYEVFYCQLIIIISLGLLL